MTQADNVNSKYVESFCKLLQCNTVSNGGDFATFHQVLEQVFPLVHKYCQKVDLQPYANGRDYKDVLLFRWKGHSCDKPLVLMAHQDVVPADESKWTHPPFSATVKDGKVYSRGAIDCKNTLFCTMQSIEELLSQGFVPNQDVYLSYSPNEEISGDGTLIVRDYFVTNNITPFLVVDEGGAIMRGDGKRLKKDVAMVGATEKGYADVKFVATSNGGHSSQPPKDTPIARIAKFVNYCETHTIFRPRATKVAKQMIYNIANALSFPLKGLAKCIYLLGGIAAPIACKKFKGMGSAMFSTTIAFTTQGGGVTRNAIPEEAWVTGNIRFLQGDSSEKIFAKLQKLCKKFNITMEVLKYREASAPIDVKGEGYKTFAKVLKQVYPEVVVAPYLMFGGTDCRHMQPIAKHAIRCTPFKLTFAQLGGMHGNNENIDVDALDRCVEFFVELVKAHK